MKTTTEHFKIWFSENKEEWMPLYNQIRLIRHREKNPSHNIYLIGADRILSDSAIEKRKKFCENFRIIYLDLDKDIPDIIKEESSAIRQKDDFELLQLANEQIDAFFQMDKPNLPPVGNLGAASDALRWLSILFKRGGIYSDLDTEIDFKNAPLFLNEDFLMPCQTVWEGIDINNNFLAISENSELADYIRKKLIANKHAISTLYIYSGPKLWVPELYGPTIITQAIREYYNLNETLSDDDYTQLAKKITEEISIEKYNLFKDKTTHLKGAGDISWVSNSLLEKKSAKLVKAAEKLTHFFKEKTLKNKNLSVSPQGPRILNQNKNNLRARLKK